MPLPSEVWEVVRPIARKSKYREDVDGATEEALKALRQLPEFDLWAAELMREAVRRVVHDVRHKDNTTRKKDAGIYHGAPASDTGAAGMLKACAEVYRLSVGGRMLGLVKGSEIPGIIDTLNRHERGVRLDRRIWQELAPLVPEDETVQEAVRPKRLQGILDRLKEEDAAEG